jgi:hypothetical protein
VEEGAPRSTLVLGGGNSNASSGTLVKDTVVVLDEHIAQDPKVILTTLNARVAQARAITQILECNIRNRDIEDGAAQLEADIVGARLERARNRPVSSLGTRGRGEDRSGNLLVDGLGGSSADDDEGGAGVNDTLGGLSKRGAVVGNVGHGDLPVTLLGDVDVGQRARVAGSVNTTEEVLATNTAVEAVGGEEDRDDGLGEEIGGDGVIKESLDAGDRLDGVEAETEETILGRGAEGSGLGSGEADGLANTDTSNVNNVGAEDSRGSGTITVTNFPLAAVLLEGRRGGRVEADVLLAGGGGAAARREPNIRGALLRYGSQLKYLLLEIGHVLEMLHNSASPSQHRVFSGGAERTR